MGELHVASGCSCQIGLLSMHPECSVRLLWLSRDAGHARLALVFLARIGNVLFLCDEKSGPSFVSLFISNLLCRCVLSFFDADIQLGDSAWAPSPRVWRLNAYSRILASTRKMVDVLIDRINFNDVYAADAVDGHAGSSFLVQDEAEFAMHNCWQRRPVLSILTQKRLCDHCTALVNERPCACNFVWVAFREAAVERPRSSRPFF